MKNNTRTKDRAKENRTDRWGRLLTGSDFQAYIGAGRSTMEKIAQASGAKRKFGQRSLYDRNAIDAYLDTLTDSETV